jgi:hypothetical protein
MNLDDFKTLTGLNLKDLAVELDKELPGDAYKPVPNGSLDLTDIAPGYMRQVLTKCFGFCGIGWGYQYDVADLIYEPNTTTKRGSVSAVLKRLEFWYVLVDGAGKENRIVIPASGGSDNSNIAYALKGAITNGLGNAASQIGFQEAVYLGHRSHNTVPGSKKTPAYGKPTSGNGNGNGNGKTATPAIQTCAIHHVPMRQFPRKDHKGTYFAHQVDGKWCYGKTSTGAQRAEPKLVQAAEQAVTEALK